jgi:hypothetical protein
MKVILFVRPAAWHSGQRVNFDRYPRAIGLCTEAGLG